MVVLVCENPIIGIRYPTLDNSCCSSLPIDKATDYSTPEHLDAEFFAMLLYVMCFRCSIDLIQVDRVC